MATYVALLKLTERGVKNVKESCKRAADFKTRAKKLGMEVREQLWCLGAYDGVLIFEAPDDDTATAAMLSLAEGDNVSTQTLRCFGAQEMSRILEKVW
jgi:uncharacterized protein with GYD domain